MSLINDALKKAQNMRAPDATGVSGPGDDHAAGGGVRRRPIPTGQWIVMIGGGAILLLILSVGTTVFLLRPRFEPPAPVVAAPEPAAPATAPLLKLTPIPLPSTESAPPPAVVQAPVVAPTVIPVIATPPPSAPARSFDAKPDPRIQTFVDEARVTGIRSSGTESKVLMNDRVYRVNDIVERSLGIRLTHVQSDTLTFEDENGVVYVKNF